MASETGQHQPHLAQDNLPAPLQAFTQYSPLVKEFTQTPGGFMFPQAIALTAEMLHSLGVKDIQPEIRFKVNPHLSFPPSDIYSVNFKEDTPQVEFVLNFLGLHGAGSPLPAYFTEHVAQNQDEQDNLRDFFDIFNHRLIINLYKTWEKYRYYILFQSGGTDKLSNHFFGFIGLGHKDMRKAKDLLWVKLLPFMGLIAFSGDSTGSLESIMRHYFGHSHVQVIPCIPRWVSIPEDQQSSLGLANATLSESSLIGSEVEDQTGKFRISLSQLTWKRFNEFLPCNAIFSELQTLVRFVLRSRLQFDVKLQLIPEEIPPLHIGEEAICRLGWSTWLGFTDDSSVTLETDYQEQAS